jgi:hypothetical protein
MSDSKDKETETLLFYQELAKNFIEMSQRWKLDRKRSREIKEIVEELLVFTKKVWDIECDANWVKEWEDVTARGDILHQTVLMKQRALHEASLSSNDPRIKQFYCIVCDSAIFHTNEHTTLW